MACDLEGSLLRLDPALSCLRDLGLAELRNTGSALSSANDSQSDLWQASAPFKARLSHL